MRGGAVVMCMPGGGHLQRLLAVIAALRARGLAVDVMGDVRGRPLIERAGGRFVDLFATRPLAATDATSIPVPSRYVTFAAVHAESVTDEVAALEPDLIVYDTFAVVAPIVARRLGIPYVNVCANHAAVPERVLADLRVDPRVATSPACLAAVRRLREVHGVADASPFSYVSAQSPFLNLYCEPPEFLAEEDRSAFAPIAFFGSLAPALRDGSSDTAGGPLPQTSGRGLRVYVSFGSVIWWYFADAAGAALAVLSESFADMDVDAVISLAGHALDPATRDALERSRVRVVDCTDQWSALAGNDLFVTHNGLNSTHEAIFHQVPMLSYPFFGDQPALARRCQELGLAVALADAPRAPIDPSAVRQAIARIVDDRAGFASRLAEARSWELRTIAGREAIVDRMLALCDATS